MKMLKKLIPFALVLTLGATAFGDDTPMEKEMSAMNKAYKALKKTVADPASKDANLKLIAEIKKTTETSIKMEPKTTADQPAAGKAAYLEKFKAQMADFAMSGKMTPSTASNQAVGYTAFYQAIGDYLEPSS